MTAPPPPNFVPETLVPEGQRYELGAGAANFVPVAVPNVGQGYDVAMVGVRS